MTTPDGYPPDRSYWFRNQGIRPSMVDALIDYVLDGNEHGHFLMAILANDLHKAVEHADMDNTHALAAFAGWCYNEAPGNCWGSPKAVEDWLRTGGLNNTNPTGAKVWLRLINERTSP